MNRLSWPKVMLSARQETTLSGSRSSSINRSAGLCTNCAVQPFGYLSMHLVIPIAFDVRVPVQVLYMKTYLHPQAKSVAPLTMNSLLACLGGYC